MVQKFLKFHFVGNMKFISDFFFTSNFFYPVRIFVFHSHFISVQVSFYSSSLSKNNSDTELLQKLYS